MNDRSVLELARGSVMQEMTGSTRASERIKLKLIVLVNVQCVQKKSPRVGPGCVLCPRIDPLRFLAGCRRRRLNQGLVVALGFSL